MTNPGSRRRSSVPGNVLYLQGDFEAATADYRRSRDLNRKLFNTHGEASALEGLGRIFMARGDYAGALDAFEGVLAEGAARSDRTAQGSATLNIGEVHFRLGNLDTARKTFEDSRGHFEAMKDAANIGRVWQAVALTDLVAGRYTMAESEYRKSIDSCLVVSDQECVAAGNVGVGFAQTAQEKFVEAIASYKRAIDAFVDLRRPEQAARAEIGLSQALSGNLDFKAALEAGTNAHQRAIAIGNDDVLWRALVSESRALRKMSDKPGGAGRGERGADCPRPSRRGSHCATGSAGRARQFLHLRAACRACTLKLAILSRRSRPWSRCAPTRSVSCWPRRSGRLPAE